VRKSDGSPLTRKENDDLRAVFNARTATYAAGGQVPPQIDDWEFHAWALFIRTPTIADGEKMKQGLASLKFLVQTEEQWNVEKNPPVIYRGRAMGCGAGLEYKTWQQLVAMQGNMMGISSHFVLKGLHSMENGAGYIVEVEMDSEAEVAFVKAQCQLRFASFGLIRFAKKGGQRSSAEAALEVALQKARSHEAEMLRWRKVAESALADRDEATGVPTGGLSAVQLEEGAAEAVPPMNPVNPLVVYSNITRDLQSLTCLGLTASKSRPKAGVVSATVTEEGTSVQSSGERDKPDASEAADGDISSLNSTEAPAAREKSWSEEIDEVLMETSATDGTDQGAQGRTVETPEKEGEAAASTFCPNQ